MASAHRWRQIAIVAFIVTSLGTPFPIGPSEWSAQAQTAAPGPEPVPPTGDPYGLAGRVQFEDAGQQPRQPTRFQVGANNATGALVLRVQDQDPRPLRALLEEEWFSQKFPGFSSSWPFELQQRQGKTYYMFRLDDPRNESVLEIQAFRLAKGLHLYSRGSPSSVYLRERPMDISLLSTPHVDVIPRVVTVRNATGPNETGQNETTYTTYDFAYDHNITLNFESPNRAGQPVLLNRSWLKSFHLTNLTFYHHDGQPISFELLPNGDYLLHPLHFSHLVVNGVPTTSPNEATRLLGGEVGVWQLDLDDHDVPAVGLTRDGSGHGNDLTRVPSTGWTQVPGQFGYAYDLAGPTGAGNYFHRWDSATLDRAGSLTAMAWVEFDTFGSTQTILVKGRSCGSSPTCHWNYDLDYDSGNNRFRFIGNTATGSTSFSVLYTKPSTILINQWHHYAGVVNTGTNTAYLYVDGSQVASAALSGTPGANDFEFSAGGMVFNDCNCVLRQVDGTMDEIRVYDRALSASDIASIKDSPYSLVCQVPGADAGGYSCTPIAYAFTDISGTGTTLSLSDDSLSGALPIGFTFTYYQTSYTTLYVSSNGFLSFEPTGTGCCSGTMMPDADPSTLGYVVAGYWEDLNPGAGGSIKYQTQGSSPSRKFLVQWTSVPHYPSGNLVTFQIVLYEGSNRVEVAFNSVTSDGGNHVTGMDSWLGEYGVRYKYGSYSVSALGVRFDLAAPSNVAPTTPYNPRPSDFATGQPASFFLEWSGGDPRGQLVTHQVFLSTTNPPPATPYPGCDGLASKSCSVSNLQLGVTYYWIVRSTDSTSISSENAAWRFTTTAPAGAGLDHNFDAGASGWTFTGFWHLTTRRSFSPSQSIWYGQEATLNYDNGATNSGYATSPAFVVPSSNPQLTFRSWFQSEASTFYDRRNVYISANGGSTWTCLASSYSTCSDAGTGTPAALSTTSITWIEQGLSLTSYAGQTVTIRFQFHTHDSVANSYEGWYVDDVKVATAANVAPFFAYTDEAGYTADGVNPDTGTRQTSFTYRIKYTDADGTTPSYVRVHVDGDLGRAMTLVGGTIAGGAIYSYSTTFATLGTHSYHFEASDGTAPAIRRPTTGELLQPAVSNVVPTACFTVTPSSGYRSTTFSVDSTCSSDEWTAISSLQVRWDWENDAIWDTVYSTTKAATKQYATIGTKTIKLEVLDGDGGTGSTTRSVGVLNQVPNACINAPLINGRTVTVSSCSTDLDNDPLTLTWDWGDFSTTTGSPATHTYACPGGNYLIKLTAADAWSSDFDTLFTSTAEPDQDLDGLKLCQEQAQGTSDTDSDYDDDGLNDYVESTAYPSRSALFCLGAYCEYPAPLTRDIYVEVDWMSKPSFHLHDHKLSSTIVTTLENRYANRGINLHIDQGELGGGNEIPHDNTFTKSGAQTDDDWDNYYNSINGNGFRLNRRAIFHYGVMAHNGAQCGILTEDVMGEGEVPDDGSKGDMFTVYRGCIDESTAPWQSEDNNVINVFMQELGHNLFGAIEPAADRDPDPDHGAPYHDIYDDRAMWYQMNGATDYHQNRWACVDQVDSHCDIDDIGNGLVGKGPGTVNKSEAGLAHIVEAGR